MSRSDATDRSPPRARIIGRCETCRWFCAREVPRDLVRRLQPVRCFGTCRCRPPVMMPDTDELWPTIGSDEYCKSWEQR